MGGTHPFADDKLREECALFGIWGADDAAAHTTLGLHALQHRGQEAAGIVSLDGVQFHTHKSLGHVGDNFVSERIITRLKGRAAVGHTRYATQGETMLRNVQPLFAELESGGFAVAHNGNLTNALTLRHDLVRRGCIFQSTTDTEVIVHLLATSDFPRLLDRLVDALRQLAGAYSLVMLTPEAMIGARDPFGVRPLVLGVLDGSHILASETCALDIIGARFVRDIEPGEVVICNDRGVVSLTPFPTAGRRFCIFEYIYFARPDSKVEGLSVYAVRKRIGAELARESHVSADMVVPVPDSGVPSALGYADAAGVPFEHGIVRNHYVGRTFIEPTQQIRNFGVKLKHNVNRDQVAGKRVVLVDDSIVRGTTSKKIVQMMREAGAREVHMRIASPPTVHSCFYGIDTPRRDELLAARTDLAGMNREIGTDTLAYISLDGLYRAVCGEARRDERPQYCDACFTGDYALPLVDLNGGARPAQLSLLAEGV
ncbi:MAG: amidophosphoribosyltransferase [Alphaproteobacteria bacterium]|nr:amidophosphoribosyltransferase [Alphaproteobacteria bacterium]